MKILNSDYYKDLLKKYIGICENNKFSSLVSKMILEHYRQQNIHFNIPNNETIALEIINKLYNELAFFAFENFADFPLLKIGDKVKKRGGKSKDIFKISKIDSCYTLSSVEDTSIRCELKYDSLLKNYTPIIQNTQEKTIKKYEDFFKPKNNHGFLPTNFTKKIVFVGRKLILNNLDNNDKIPTVYLPNIREENDQIPQRSIPSLTDCMIYTTSKYDICYEQLIKKNIKIDTIVVCGDFEKLEQILQDKSIYKFNLIILSNKIEPVKNNTIPCWDWKKEEIKIIEGNNDSKKIHIERIIDLNVTFSQNLPNIFSVILRN